MADDIVVRIRAEGTGEFVKDLKKAGGVVEDTGEKIEDVNKKTESSFKSLGKTIGAALATGAIIEFGRVMIKTATDINATNAKIQTVFGDSAKAVEDFAKKSATSLGLTVNQYKRAAAAVGDLLIPIGFQRKEAAQLSNELVKLSGALAAWTGGQLNASQVSDILTKALLGEREQLKQLGIQISEADVKAQLLTKGQDKLTGAALAQAKALATLELITSKSADAQAAFGDDTTTLAEATLQLNAQVLELRDNLAEGLIPFLTKVVELGNNAVSGWRTFFKLFDGVPDVVEAARELSPVELSRAINATTSELKGLTEGSLEYLKVQNKLRALQAEQTGRGRGGRRGGAVPGLPPPETIEDTSEELEKLEKAMQALFRASLKTVEVVGTDQDSLFRWLEELQEQFRETKTAADEFAESLIGDNALQISDTTQAAVDGFRKSADAATSARIEDKDAAEQAKKAEQDRIALQQQRVGSALEGIDNIGQANAALFNSFIGFQQAELTALEKKYAQGLISEKEFQEGRKEILEKQARADKANAVFQTVIATAAGIAKAIPNIPLIALSAAIGAAQLATIAAQPIPQFAKGTKGRKTAPEGFAWVGEQGPELVQMKGGEKVITAGDSEKIAKILGSYGIPTQFKNPAEELYKPMSAMRGIVEMSKELGIDWNPLLNSNDINRRSSGKKLDRIHMELIKMNKGINRRMTKA